MIRRKWYCFVIKQQSRFVNHFSLKDIGHSRPLFLLISTAYTKSQTCTYGMLPKCVAYFLGGGLVINTLAYLLGQYSLHFFPLKSSLAYLGNWRLLNSSPTFKTVIFILTYLTMWSLVSLQYRTWTKIKLWWWWWVTKHCDRLEIINYILF